MRSDVRRLPGAVARDAPLPEMAEDVAQAHEPAAVARLAGGTLVREIRSARRPADDEVREISLGWKSSLALNLVLLCAPTGTVIALPPMLDCRERAQRFGFFAGETLQACASRGIGARLTLLDDRIKMLVRGSGR